MENLECDRPHVLFLHRVCLRARVWSHATHDQAWIPLIDSPTFIVSSFENSKTAGNINIGNNKYTGFDTQASIHRQKFLKTTIKHMRYLPTNSAMALNGHV